jgi:hypothetical protein
VQKKDAVCLKKLLDLLKKCLRISKCPLLRLSLRQVDCEVDPKFCLPDKFSAGVFFLVFSFLAFSQECRSGGSASVCNAAEAEPLMWHFQAKPGNEIRIGFFYCESDGRGIEEIRRLG